MIAPAIFRHAGDRIGVKKHDDIWWFGNSVGCAQF
jgi:hypothetical protein